MRAGPGAGERPSLKDWETHLTTIFPEVRLKRYMEMRRRRRRAHQLHLRAAGLLGGAAVRPVRLPPVWHGRLRVCTRDPLFCCLPAQGCGSSMSYSVHD